MSAMLLVCEVTDGAGGSGADGGGATPPLVSLGRATIPVTTSSPGRVVSTTECAGAAAAGLVSIGCGVGRFGGVRPSAGRSRSALGGVEKSCAAGGAAGNVDGIGGAGR